MSYNTNKGCHAVYSIQFHYVACIKYRRKVLVGDVAQRLKEINLKVADKFGVTIVEQEAVGDHLHLLFSCGPQVQLSKLVNSIKAVSARLLFQEFPFLRSKTRGNHLWSPSYFLASVGEVDLETLKRYVENQNDQDT